MLFYLDENDARPIYRQIAGQVKTMLLKGELAAGDELPSVRELADSLDINLHTVHSAYRTLRDEGIINLRLGRRAVIARPRRQPSTGVENNLSSRLQEIIAEALQQGLSADDFRRLVENSLNDGGHK